MSEKDPGLLDELKKWLEFDEPDEGGSSIDNLKEQLAMETDPEKRKALKSQIKNMEQDEEAADLPTPGFTGVF